MVVLGLDPGSVHLGYALGKLKSHQEPELLEMGTIELPPKVAFAKRLSQIQERIEQIVDHHRPEWVIIEKVFMGLNADTAFRLGHVRGVCMAVAAGHECEISELAARQVKKLVTGYGAATKEQMQLMLRQTYPIVDSNSYDAADALALVVAFSRLQFSNQILSEVQA